MANDTAPNLDSCAYNTLAWQGSFSCSAGELTVVHWLQHHFVSAKYLSELRAIACTSCLLKVYPIGEPTATIGDAAGKLQCFNIETLVRPPKHSAFFMDAAGLPWEHSTDVTGV